MKNIIIGIVLASIGFVGISSARTIALDTKTGGIVLVNTSDDGKVGKYYDYDANIVCYRTGASARPEWQSESISCLQLR